MIHLEDKNAFDIAKLSHLYRLLQNTLIPRKAIDAFGNMEPK